MAQSNAQVQAAARKLEAKALAMPKKSDGMRLLLNAGQSIVEVRRVFNAPYGFVYGVADRAGLAETAASRRTPRKAKVAAKATKVTKVASAKTPRGAAAKVTATVRAQRATAREAKVTPAARQASARKATPVAKVAGRPTAARRAANRKSAQKI